LGMSPEQLANLRKNPQKIGQLIQENQLRIHQNQLLLQMIMEGAGAPQIMGNINGKQMPLNNEQIIKILHEQQGTIERLTNELNAKK